MNDGQATYVAVQYRLTDRIPIAEIEADESFQVSGEPDAVEYYRKLVERCNAEFGGVFIHENRLS